jgi:hypothetical protein
MGPTVTGESDVREWMLQKSPVFPRDDAPALSKMQDSPMLRLLRWPGCVDLAVSPFFLQTVVPEAAAMAASGRANERLQRGVSVMSHVKGIFQTISKR